MKLKSTPIVTGVFLLSLCSASVFAADAAQSEEQSVQKLTNRTAMLEREVEELKAELRSMHAQSKAAKKHHKGYKIKHPSAGVVATEEEINGAPLPEAKNGEVAPVHPVRIFSDSPLYIGGTPIVASPYVGVPTEFNASNLITFLSKVNTDLQLLQQQQKLHQTYDKYCLPYPDHPFIDISGNLQAIAMQSRPYENKPNPNGYRTSDVDLAVAELDVAVMFSKWVTGFMTLNYDNNPSNSSLQRSANSRFFLDRGFVTIGNLSATPFYGSIGQLYVPFGQYSSYMVSDPLTKLLARTKARAAVLGYDQDNGIDQFIASVFTFKGDSFVSQSSGMKINNYGANVNYLHTQDKWKVGVGASYIANIADSGGFQTVFSKSAGAETLQQRVPALALRGNAKAGDFTLLGEYIMATQAFSPLDLTLNNAGAKPSAGNIELNYGLTMFPKPTSIAVGYGWTRDALGLMLPKQRYVATLNTSLWRSTIESLEYRHDVDYGSGDMATTHGVAIGLPGTGHSSDSITAQLAVFF